MVRGKYLQSTRPVRSRDSSLYGIRVVKRGRGSSQNRDRSNEFKSHLVDRQRFRPDWLHRIAEIKIHDDRPKISLKKRSIANLYSRSARSSEAFDGFVNACCAPMNN